MEIWFWRHNDYFVYSQTVLDLDRSEGWGAEDSCVTLRKVRFIMRPWNATTTETKWKESLGNQNKHHLLEQWTALSVVPQ